MNPRDIHVRYGRLLGQITALLSVEDAYPPRSHRRNGDDRASLAALVSIVRERAQPITADQRRAFAELCEALDVSNTGIGNLPEISEEGRLAARAAKRAPGAPIRERLAALIDAYADRLDERHVTTLRNAAEAGDPDVALHDFAAGMAAREIAMSAAERDDLRTMLMVFGEPLDDWTRIPVRD